MLTAELQQVLDGYKAAVYAKDVEGVLALYGEHARIFDLWERWVYDGAPAWKEAVAQWFGSLGSERVIVELSEVRAHSASDLAVVSAFIRYQGVSADGQALRAMHNRVTWALERQGGVWKIVQEHTSAPVSFESGRVLLQR